MQQEKNGETLGVMLKRARMRRGLTQRQLAASLGLRSNAWISRLEKGRRPSLGFLLKLEKALEADFFASLQTESEL